MNQEDIRELIAQFQFDLTEKFSIQTFGAGLIHQTFLIECRTKKYILQGFNENVFKFSDRIEKNLGLLSNSGQLALLPFQLPLPILNLAGDGMVKYNGKLFRLFDFVEGQTLQQISSPNQARMAAEAYSLFSKWADRFSLDEFEETIPNFHRLDLRYNRLVEVAKTAKELNPEEKEILDFYLSQDDLVKKYLQTCQQVPKRLTHNDTKINNLIFSNDLSKVAAVVDLDTIMPGFLFYDFGDLVRTVASSVEETSQDFDSQSLNLTIFEELLTGYWSGAGKIMTHAEAQSLLIGGEVMTCLMGVRFFTDHLEGNVYYQVAYPQQNFDRAKNQMSLLQSMQAQRVSMESIFSKVTGFSN